MTKSSHKDFFSHITPLFKKDIFGFFLIFLVGFVTLVSLGTWQLIRLQEKNIFIADISDKLSQDPRPLEDLLQAYLQDSANVGLLKTQATGTINKQPTFKLMAQTHEGNMGYHIIKVMTLSSGGNVLIDLGWVPMDKSPEDISFPEEPITIKGTLRLKSASNSFTPENNYKTGKLYAINPTEIIEKTDLKDLYPVFIGHVTVGPTDNGLPIKKPFHLTIRNQHLNYALTWFSLSIVWLLCFVFFIRSRNRKRLSP